jgi:hypothetical protein
LFLSVNFGRNGFIESAPALRRVVRHAAAASRHQVTSVLRHVVGFQIADGHFADFLIAQYNKQNLN